MYKSANLKFVTFFIVKIKFIYVLMSILVQKLQNQKRSFFGISNQPDLAQK